MPYNVGDRVVYVNNGQDYVGAEWQGLVVLSYSDVHQTYSCRDSRGYVGSFREDMLRPADLDKFLLYKGGRVISHDSVALGRPFGNDAWTRPEIDQYTAAYLTRHGTGEFHVVPLRSIATINQDGTTEHA